MEVRRITRKSAKPDPKTGKVALVIEETRDELVYTRQDALMIAWHARALVGAFYGAAEDLLYDLAETPGAGDDAKATYAKLAANVMEAQAHILQDALDELGRAYKCPWPIQLKINEEQDSAVLVTFPDSALGQPETHVFSEGAFGPDFAAPPAVSVHLNR